jgi:hypothetical protein
MDARLQGAIADFSKDNAKETGGAWAHYKGRQYLIARAHRNNVLFSKIVEAKMKPYRRLIDTGNIEAMKDRAAEVMREVYAESILMGVRDTDGQDIPYTSEDGKVLLAVPDLWDFVFKNANQDDNFATEAESKNLSSV